MPTVTMPPIAPAGLPKGVKDSLRADFRTNEFVKMVERGNRLVWQRAARCPCTSNNKQTDQSDPNCPSCKGVGWIYFSPPDYTVDTDAGRMTDAQAAIVASIPGAVIIRGIMVGIAAIANAVDKIGPWEQGTASCTVRHENKLGFYDKLINLDNEIAYNQIVKASGAGTLKTRYPCVGVNYLASVAKIYVLGQDYTLDKSTITWLPLKAPKKDTTITVHYLIHPTWIVVEHPRSVRVATIKRKQRVPDSPMGSPAPLPVQATVRYDFLAFA